MILLYQSAGHYVREHPQLKGSIIIPLRLLEISSDVLTIAIFWATTNQIFSLYLFFFLSRSLNIISSELSTSIHSQYMDKETLLINFYHSRFVLDSDMPLFKHFYDVLYLSSISSLHYISQMYFNIHRCILLEYDFISGTLSFFSCCLTYKCISFMVLLILNVLLWNHNINYVIYLIKINLIFL